jgi:hypothetical protein
MNHSTRLLNSNNTRTPATGWKVISACTTLTIAAVVGFTSFALTSTATAQDRTTESEADQDRSMSGQFPSKELMADKVNAEAQQGKLTEMQTAAIMRVHARLVMGLESGRISVDEALTIMEERTIAILEQKPGVTRQDYAKAQAAMQKMVDAGEITKELMDARLSRLRKMIGRAQPQITRQDYAKAQAAMQKMVDAGEITKAQMDARLKRMQEAIRRSNGE